jgi:SUN domain-containing protein 1/2
VSPTRRPISSASHRPPSPSRSIASRHSQQEPEEDPQSTFPYTAESRADTTNAEAPAARYARLKQRNLAQHTGPGTIVSPPKPNGITYRDTTVNVASAFNQAAEDYTMSNTNGAYTSTTTTRRGLPDPPPSRARKQTSKKGPNDEDVDEDGRTRGKSPLPEIASAFVRAVSPSVQAITTYVLRQKPTDEDESQTGFQSFALPPSNKPRSHGTLHANQSGTSHAVSQEYNYSREESLANRMDSSTDKTVVRRRPRHSVNADNKAYKPTKDDEFSEDDYSTDDGRGGRRKKLKPVQKKATNLPSLAGMAGHSKRKSTSRKRRGPNGEEEITDDEAPVRVAYLLPLINTLSVSQPHRSTSAPRSLRGSVPPAEVEPALDEGQDLSGGGYADEYGISDSQAHPASSKFSIGGLLGKGVNLAFRTVGTLISLIAGFVSMVLILTLRVLASIFDIVVVRPYHWFSSVVQRAEWGNIFKYIAGLVALYIVATAASSQGSLGLSSLVPSWTTPINLPQNVSAGTISDLTRRLQEVENRLADILFAQRRVSEQLDVQSRSTIDASSKVSILELSLQQEIKGRHESEEKFRGASAAAVQNLRAEVLSLVAQLGKVDHSVADAKLLALEGRLRETETNMRDALESVKMSIKHAPAPSQGTGSSWWDKVVGKDGSQITIKSADGQDVTSLIDDLVLNAVLRWQKDSIAKPDYAMYYAGGRVIPGLTTNTYSIQPRGILTYAWGAITGRGILEGRPPVTALHPDISVGNCWPISGSKGQLAVMLARSVIITEFTIDHAAKEVAHDVRPAPKKMEVWGLVEGKENIRKVEEYHRRREQRYRDLAAIASREGRHPPPKEDPCPDSLPESETYIYIRLAQFTYDLRENNHIQTFSVPQEIQDLGVDISIVVLFIQSNWGQPEWTCLYRFRVHGLDVDRRPYPLPDIDA